jgi:hypothetical protein
MCKGVQEPSEEIVIWESKIKDLISELGVASVHPPFLLGFPWSSKSSCLLLLVIAIT